MALSKEQLAEAMEAITSRFANSWTEAQDRKWGKLSTAVANELNRLTHGPFTLAEAIASGRPFRRKVWTEDYQAGRWATRIYVGQEEQYFTDDIHDGDGFPEFLASFNQESATATDYELQEGGE